MENTDLQKSKESVLRITRTSDLFKARPILIQRTEHGDDMVLNFIRVSLEKCAYFLGIGLSESQVITLCRDLVDVYSYDSIEDIQQCLKKARQGQYGFGHHKRDILTMGLIREWMTQHLEEKASERERIIHNRKYKESEPVEDKKALEYLAKIKKNIADKIKEQSKVKPFENSESAWKKIIKDDPILRNFFNLNN